MKKIIKKIANKIKGTPFENRSYVVGGYVRDRVMGKTSSDLDIVVELFDGGIKLANYLYKEGIASRPFIFPRFSTAVIQINHHKIEFVMTRKEFYIKNSRKPDVDHATIQEDVLRRDFTVNTLLMNISTGEILDLTGQGKSDIKNKIIRSTSEADEIFVEDPLRMLRAIRFAVQLGFKIEESTKAGINRNNEMLSTISRERQRDELEKILLSSEPVRGVNLLIDFNLISTIIPEFKKRKYLNSIPKVLRNSEPDLSIRLAIFLNNYELSKVENILRRLKFSNRQIRSVKLLIRNYHKISSKIKRGHNLSDAELRKIIYNNPHDLNQTIKILKAFFTNVASLKEYKVEFSRFINRLLELNNIFSEKTFPVDGEDIKNTFNIVSGPKVGLILKKAKNLWFKHPNWSKNKILKSLKIK